MGNKGLHLPHVLEQYKKDNQVFQSHLLKQQSHNFYYLIKHLVLN